MAGLRKSVVSQNLVFPDFYYLNVYVVSYFNNCWDGYKNQLHYLLAYDKNKIITIEFFLLIDCVSSSFVYYLFCYVDML